MTEPQKPTRLVTFLGRPPKGQYEPTNYQYRGETIQTEFAAEALSKLLCPRQVVVLATREAWTHDGHGARLLRRLKESGTGDVSHREIPTGRDEGELWQQFTIIKEELRGSCGPVALDITHGFRSQPFFAAGAITFVRLVDSAPVDVQIYYGAFEAQQDGCTPIWDLTAFADLISWSSDLMLFLRTGRAAGLAEATERLGRTLRKAWAVAGQVGAAPCLDALGRALARFGSDLETVRTGSLLLGTQERASCSGRLLAELDNAQRDVAQAAPPLADVMERIRSMVQPLRTNARLSEPEGLHVLQALANLYLDMGRYAEAAATMREAWINHYAGKKADCPGQADFSEQHRKAAEEAWFEANKDKAKEVAQVRNDLEHAGYNAQPMPAETIKERLKTLISGLPVGDQRDA